MTTSTLTIGAARRQRTPSTGQPGRSVDPARITSALARYEESQSGYAALSEPARHAVLEIGDRLQGLHDAFRPAELAWSADLGADGTSESLVACALHDAVDPYLDVLSREIGFAARKHSRRSLCVATSSG
ncbi:MAG TPA: hypothetical protein VGI05_25120 [Streptosporangiaceae bacterium]|jgi:hypothetical protein